MEAAINSGNNLGRTRYTRTVTRPMMEGGLARGNLVHAHTHARRTQAHKKQINRSDDSGVCW